MNNDANFINISTPSKQNENLDTGIEDIQKLEAKYKTEYKINRIHRLSPSNIEEEKTNDNLNSHFKTQSNKKMKEEINEEIHKEEIEKELNQRKRIEIEFKKIYAKFRMDRLASEENSINIDNDAIETNSTGEQNKKENIFYYIINKTWFNMFKNYLTNRNLTYSKLKDDYPGEINNQHLILQDDSCLKLNSEKRIIINLKYSCNCICISEDLWMFLVNHCGGGPEIKFRPYKLNNNHIDDINEISTIRQGVHINLIFIPKKQIISNSNNKEPSDNLINPLNPFQSQDIIKMLKRTEINNRIRKEKIYFDNRKNVKELINYINQILNQHRSRFTNTPIFFGPSFNNEGSNLLVENINYRIWLLYTDANEDDIPNIIQEGITKYEDADFPMNFNQINNNLENIIFAPYLLNNFLNCKVSEIFPNKLTKNFNNSNYYNNIEDVNSMPVLNLLIEEFPYHFEEPKKNYYIKKCNGCHYRDYAFVGCKCQKVFYCSIECQKKNIGAHILKCRIALFNYLVQRNANFSRVILGRKDYYDKNKNEKEKFSALGLSNLGNSCYMNSALQCLFNIKELSNFFLYNFDEKYLNKDNILGTGGLLTLGYINLLLIYNNNTNNKYITPETFKIILGLCSKKFEGNEQEDSHEFISYLLDMLHEDLNRVKYNPKDKNTSIKYDNNNKYTDEEKSIIDWNNFLKRNQSVLIDIFYGQLKSCVICPNCNYNSINFNSFLSLELSINSDKNFKKINIEFIDYFSESPNINFNIILYKEENKVYFVRKKIANLLNIDLLSFELGLIHNNKIIHLLDLNEEINEHISNIIAYRVNPDYFYSEKNSRFNEVIMKEIIINENENENSNNNGKHIIDFENLEHNINKRKNEIIKYNENKNISDDFLSLNLLYKDNLGFDHNVFQRVIIENFTIRNKHYKNMDKDEVLYLEKNKSCQEIYFQIFKKYAFNLVVQNFNSEKRNRFIELYKSDEKEKIDIKIRKLFLAFFKNIYLHPSKINLRDNFPHCPFVLFLKNEKYEINELIPINSDINYQEILKIFYDGINFQKNKYNHISQYNSIPINNNNNQQNIQQSQENNDNINVDYLLDVINMNNEPNGMEDNKGLKGGKQDENNEEDSSSSENEDSEETDNNENENENENNTISDNSSEKANMLDDDLFDINPFNNNEGYNTTPRRQMIFRDELENVLKYKNEKDENMDRITIIWNSKFIKDIVRFTDINLYDICDKIYEKSTNKDIKLEKLLEEFSKEEKLDKDNLYRCENCKEELEANKKIEIYHLPKILIIHLKRFNNNKKINTFIDYPLTDLDLNNYIKSQEKVPKYDLIGVINHFGSLEYGHYTAFCLNYHDKNWYEYNDRIVNKIQIGKEKDSVVNKYGYILFYKSQDIEKINWDCVYKKEYEIIKENNLKKFGENLIYTTLPNEEKEDIIIDNEEIKETVEEKNEIIIQDEKEIEINANEKEIDDDNFSFKEGMNNKSISNISYENDIQNNEKEVNPLEETPKFKNKSKNNEEIKGQMLNFNINESPNITNQESEIKKNEIKTEIKRDNPLNKIEILNNNTIRIMTYIKPRKKENKKIQEKNEDNNKSKDNDINKDESELLKYDLFNINKTRKNYFKLNPKNANKGIQSVKNKELNLFFLKEISDNTSNKFPRSKKLYDEESLKKENKEQINISDQNEDIKEINTKDINLEDYVYNPFKNCYAKLRKFAETQ